MLITKVYNDLTYWKKSTYENLCTYDSSDNEIFFDDSSSNISLSEDLFSNDSPKFNLPKQNDLKDSESDNSNDDDESELSFVIHRRKVKRKRARGASQFIMDEADDDECCEDDDELQAKSEDTSLLDFIDDEEVEECDEDMQVNYMQSVADVINQKGKYKLKFDYDPDIQVYSQFPSTQEIEDDEYDKDDSFICDEIIYSNTQPAPVNISSPRRLRSRKTCSKFKRHESTPVEKPKKRFKRVIIESP